MVAQRRKSGQPPPQHDQPSSPPPTSSPSSAPSPKLRFREKLVGKGFSTDVLLKKLKSLHAELAELDQDVVDTDSLAPVCKELIHPTILLHKDQGVKAYAACSLADLLRLYAPDAPYTDHQLRDIFQFFFTQLARGLANGGADAPFYTEYFHLLESLSSVKSVVLICDLPGAEQLEATLFRNFFGLIRSELPKKVELFMADILIAIVDESSSFSQELLEIIMAQFMDKRAEMDNPAYRLAVSVCTATADKLQRHVCQYFTDIIVAHSPAHDASDSDSDAAGPAAASTDDVRRAHDLIQRLHRAAPALLHNVIPQLEEELRIEDVGLRALATRVLGEMYADKAGADLARRYPTTWAQWLLRKNDKAAAVRLTLVERLRDILASIPERRADVEAALAAKLLDPDEKVRAAVCRIVGGLDYETALHHVSEELLKGVGSRGLDKKHSVRTEALNSLGKLYALAYSEIENGDALAVRHFSWIPNTILQLSTTTTETKAAAEPVVAQYILPLPSPSGTVDEEAWTDRLLTVMRYLEERSVSLLIGMTSIKQRRPTIFERFVDACVANNGGIIDENEEAVVDRLQQLSQRIAGAFLDRQRASDDLLAFAKLNEGRLYKLLKTCLDTQTDLRTLAKSSHEFTRRVEQAAPALLPTLTTFLRKSSLRILNQSSIPPLLRRLPAAPAHALLTAASKHLPQLYVPHVPLLYKTLSEHPEVTLQALAAVARWDRDKRVGVGVGEGRLKERVKGFVGGNDARCSKFAARLVCWSWEEKAVEDYYVQTIADGLPDADEATLTAHLAVLVEIARDRPEAFETRSEEIIVFLVKQVLMQPVPIEPDMDQSNDEWIDDALMPPRLRAKVLALKVCRNRCLAQARISTDVAGEIARPVLKMLVTLLEHAGALRADSDDDLRARARVRTQAAVSLLHLAATESFRPFITQHFVLLALTMQDPAYQVRHEFLRKLVSLLQSQRLPASFNVIPFLAVHDPEADILSIAKGYILFAYRMVSPEARLQDFEMIFVRFLHLLAHHPDFALTPDALPDMARYIEFYCEQIANAETVSLLYHLAGRLKTVRDAGSHTHSENLYALSELAQHVIKMKAQAHGWALEVYPKKFKLPADILRPLPTPDAANQIIRRTYLPEEAVAWIKEQEKVNKAAAAAEAKSKTARKPRKRKAPAAKTNGQTKCAFLL
ncbi:cohesin-associated protein Pds5 [Vararia minispora EC-137]|uniref:Cohesin-associated protein Pds5 n=1 Tax=Vararia minispora EC-137 TaxID=1314806 RepID=A0ACB8QZQ0_9AGAM|nr:cohesin-associated protein Pds5 [Vararia minispora EC-137]